MSHNTTPASRERRDEGVRRHRRVARVLSGDRVHDVMKVQKVPRGSLRPGSVVLAQVPFTDSAGHKTRPVVIVRIEGREVVCCKCTTTGRRLVRATDYVEVVDLTTAGLSRATGVERRTIRLDRSAITDLLGELAEQDREVVLSSTILRVAA